MPDFVANHPPQTLTVTPHGGEACVHEFPDDQPVTIPDDHARCIKMARLGTAYSEV